MNNHDHSNDRKSGKTGIFTLWDLREYILECDLPASQIAFLRSAIKRADALIGHGLLDLPADQRIIFDRLEQLSPAMAGMTDQSFANMKSRLRKAFRLARGLLFNPRSRYALTGDWGELQASLDTKMQRATSRLFHFAASQGVLPRHMSDAVIERFAVHLRDEAMVSDWLGTLRGSIKAWNRLAASRVDLPQLAPPPSKRTSYWIAQSEWPQTLVTELDAFLESLASLSGFEARRTKPLKPGTIQQYRYNVTVIVSALVHTGTSMSALAHLPEVIRPENVNRTLQFLQDRAGGTVTSQMFQLALRVRTIARWCDMPDNELARLDLIFYNVRDQREHRRGMTTKNRQLLDKLEDQRFADKVQLLPIILLEQAMKSPDKRNSAARARTAMASELLLVCSVRRANLVNLELGKSIRKIGQGDDAYWIIEHDASEVKNEEDLRFRLPEPTAAMLEIYLKEWRPKLCSAPNPWLFPSADGNCIDPRTMAYAIGAQSKRVLGVAITPHQFRHISAELFLMDHPDALFTISQHLGHRDVNTTRRYYARPKQRQASQHFQENVLRRRENARIRIKRRKGGKATQDFIGPVDVV